MTGIHKPCASPIRRLTWPLTVLLGIATSTELSAQQPPTRTQPFGATQAAGNGGTAGQVQPPAPSGNSQPAGQPRPGQPSGHPEHPLVPAIRIAKTAKGAVDAMQDYQGVFSKREVVNGRLVTQTMRFKFRPSPFSVYFHFLGEHQGREVLYVDGQNNNEILAHEGSGVASLVGTVSLPPDSPKATQDSRHPITRFGMSALVQSIVKQWEFESQYGEIDVKYYADAKLGDQPCRVIESSHPRPRRQFPFHKTRLFLASDTLLPIRVEQYGFPQTPGGQPPLIEEYTYTQIMANQNLTAYDFDRRNQSYRF